MANSISPDNTTVAQIAPGGVFFARPDPFRRTPTRCCRRSSRTLRHHAGQSGPDSADRPSQHRRRWPPPGHHDFNDYRYVLGAKGDFANHTWDYDFWWQSGTNRLQQITGNYFRQGPHRQGAERRQGPEHRPAGLRVGPRRFRHDLRAVRHLHNGGVTQAALNYLNTPGFSERLHAAERRRSAPGLRPRRLPTAGRCPGPRTASASRSASSIVSSSCRSTPTRLLQGSEPERRRRRDSQSIYGQ